MGLAPGKPVQTPFCMLSLAQAAGAPAEVAEHLAVSSRDFTSLSPYHRKFIAPGAYSFPTLPFFRRPESRMQFADLAGGVTDDASVHVPMLAEGNASTGSVAVETTVTDIDPMRVDPESGIPWGMARPDMGSIDPSRVSSSDLSANYIFNIMRMQGDAELAMNESERILHISSLLWVLSSDDLWRVKGKNEWRECMRVYAIDGRSILKLLSGCIASAFHGDSQHREHVRSTLTNEGLVYPHAVVRVKAALAMLYMQDTHASLSLTENWGRLKPLEQDQVIRLALERPEGTMEVSWLPVVGHYLAAAQANRSAHDDGVIGQAERWMDLAHFRKAISDDPALLQAAKEEWIRGREEHNALRGDGWVEVAPDGLSRDEAILGSMMGIIQTAFCALAGDHTGDARRLAENVVRNNLGRLVGTWGDGPPHEVARHETLIRTIPFDNVLSVIRPLLEVDDLAARITAARIIFNLSPKSEEVPKAVDAIRNLLVDEGIREHFDYEAVRSMFVYGTFRECLVENGLFGDPAVMAQIEWMATSISPELPHAEDIYYVVMRYGSHEAAYRFLSGVPSIDAVHDSFESDSYLFFEGIGRLVETATDEGREPLRKLFVQILATSESDDVRLYASQGLALMGVYDSPEQQTFLRTMIERDLAALPRDMRRIYLFGRDDIESLSPMETTLVAAAHGRLVLNMSAPFFFDTMLEQPEDSPAYRYARSGLIYARISGSLYESGGVYGHVLDHPARDAAKAIYGGIRGDVNVLRASMTGTKNNKEQERRFDEFREALHKARESLEKPK